MPRTKRTPPPSPNNKDSRQKSGSDPQLSTGNDNDTATINTNLRGKRQRLEDSPVPKQSNLSDDSVERLRNELREILFGWKSEQDQRFTNWKAEQDATLSLLIKDVSDLKRQCLQIQKSNNDIEKGMEFINHNHEDLKKKIDNLEDDKKKYMDKITKLENQIQDIRFQTRPATIELRNVPLKELEKSSDLRNIVTDIGKAVELNIKAEELRDIYRLPGKPGTTRPIVAEFHSVPTRNTFLTSVRRFNKERPISEKLNTNTIGMSGEKKAIYVDEHLTPALKKLLFETRLVAKAQNYSCWHSNGRILMRLEKDAKPIEIKTEQCLAFLVKK